MRAVSELLDEAAAAAGTNLPAAAMLLREVLRRDRASVPALQLLAFVCLRQGKTAKAAQLLDRALALRPTMPALWRSRGVAALAANLPAEAIPFVLQAAKLEPGHALCWSYLGDAYRATGRPVDALRAYKRALRLAAELRQILEKIVLTAREAQLRTIECWALRRLALIEPRPEYLHALGLSLCYSGRVPAGLRQFRKVIALDPAASVAQSGIAMGCQMAPRFSPAQVFLEHRRWERIHQRETGPAAPSYVRSRRGGPLRVGYVSGQFTDCSHSFFFEPILAGHRRSQVQAYCYSNSEVSDGVTERLRGHAYRWRTITGSTDAEAAAVIGRDGIDVLVDLDGHAKGNRLTLFAARPVRIQATYLGYPNTTGLRAIDYRFTDGTCDPPGETEQYHTESLLRLDPCFLTYRPPDDAPPVAVPTGRPVTFACFNAMSKISTECLALFAEVLRAVPDSRLLLKCQSFHDPALVRRAVRFFAARGVAETRITALAFSTTRLEHLLRYHEADIALDSSPYVGTTTTCESLWMGVPVVSLVGRTHVQRVGKTLLTQAGLPELAVDTREAYVTAAARLAQDRRRLAGIRQNLRWELRRSALLQPAAFVDRFEKLLHGMAV